MTRIIFQRLGLDLPVQHSSPSLDAGFPPYVSGVPLTHHVPSSASTMQSQFEKALSQIQDKPPVPELDFTQHHLDDGSIGA